jgi:putative oxidoreductase
MNIVELVRSRILPALERMQWLGPLLVRLSLGAVFITSGWGKLHNLGQVTTFFTELGIPFPGFNATLASSTELVGGALILLGLFTRLAAIPLIFTMLVAIGTAKRPEIDGVTTLLGFIEFTYIAGFAWLLVSGAGRASLDALLFGRKRLDLPRPLIRPPPSTAEQR